MSVAHDLNLLEEQKRKEAARKLVAEAARKLQGFRMKSRLIETDDETAWQEARFMAQELIWAATPLDLRLLVACSNEVLHFVERRFAGEPLHPDLALYMLSALDTLGMELERLQCDRDLR